MSKNLTVSKQMSSGSFKNVPANYAFKITSMQRIWY